MILKEYLIYMFESVTPITEVYAVHGVTVVKVSIDNEIIFT